MHLPRALFLNFWLLSGSSLVTIYAQGSEYHLDIDPQAAVASILMAGGQGAAVPLDVENYPVAPAELELKQVHVFVRHGERTPVGVRMAGPPASIPEHWMMCKNARRFRAAVAGWAPSEDAEVASNKGGGGRGRRTRFEHEEGGGEGRRDECGGECLLGELTDIGRQTTYNYGSALRKLYVEKLAFLPDVLKSESETYFRSTNMPRTIESLQQIIHGLYPLHKRDEDVTAKVLIRNGKDENLIGNTYACKRLEVLLASFAHAAATAFNPALQRLDEKLSKYIDGHPFRIDGKPRASGVLDTVRAAAANGFKIPPEFEEKSVIDILEKAVVTEWFAGYKTEEVQRLGMGRLLSDLSTKMQHKVDRPEEETPKILIHSTHDTALAGLCTTLDVYDEKWPAFTAGITFELFRRRESPNGQSYLQAFLGGLSWKRPEKSFDYYVRMRYQNKNMILPTCADEGKHLPGSPELCTFEAFRARVKELTPKDWGYGVRG